MQSQRQEDRVSRRLQAAAACRLGLDVGVAKTHAACQGAQAFLHRRARAAQVRGDRLLGHSLMRRFEQHEICLVRAYERFVQVVVALFQGAADLVALFEQLVHAQEQFMAAVALGAFL